MTAPEILQALEDSGIEIRAVRGELRVRAPAGALTPDLRRRLQENKASLLEHLQDGSAAGIPRTWSGEDTQLSSMQERMWYFSRIGLGSAYNVVAAYRLEGRLDHEAMLRAINHVVARHATLRSSIVEEDGKPRLSYSSSLELRLPVEDLSSLPEDRRFEECRERIRQEYFHEFDVAEPPLLYFKLFRLAEDDWVLYCNLHHALTDAFSFTVLVKELAAGYAAFSRGEEPELPALKLQFPDWIRWQRDRRFHERIEMERAWWMEKLAPPLTPFGLAPEQHRESAFQLTGRDFPFEIRPKLVERLTEVGRTVGATPFMVVMASLKLAIHCLTGADDIVVGTPVAGRGHPELRPLIGAFLNTVAVRSRVDGSWTLREFLAREADEVRGALAHQEIPFSEVVRSLDLPNDPTRTPVYQVSLNLWDASDRPEQWGDLDATRFHVSTPWTHTEFAVWLMKAADGGIRGSCTYARDLFDAHTAERLGRAIHQVLELYPDRPDMPVSEISLVTEDEREDFARWNETRRPLAYDTTPEGVAAQVAGTPGAVAVSRGEAKLTYEELWRRSGAVACALRERGVGPGSVVGSASDRMPEMVVALLGIWRSGAAYLPLDVELPPGRLRFMVEDADAALVVTHGVSLPELDAAGVELSALETGEPGGGREEEDLPEVAGDDLAYVIYTSGSTGRPKGTEISHRSLANFLQSMAREPGFGSDDRLLAVTTLSFDISGLEVWLPLTVGGRVEIASEEESRSGELLRRRIAESGATVMQATPSTWRMLVRAGWEEPLRAVFCGGEVFPRDLTEALLARAEQVWNLYGPTETTVWSTVWRVRGTEEGAVPIGRPIDNTTVHVVDPESGRLLPSGVPGELWIGGAGVAQGYRDRPELTAASFLADPAGGGGTVYRTGDLVRWRPDGQLDHLGRMDTQVQVHGHRVELEEVEIGLASLPGVEEAVVSVASRGPGDARLVAFVVPAAGEAVLGSRLRRSLRDILPPYMIPGVFLEIDEVPLTPNGKIDRRALPDPLTPARTLGFEAPRTELERTVASVWSDLLPVERIGRTDNFFELGGHSLLAIQAVARLAERTGRRLDPRTLFFDDLARVSAALES